MNDRTNDEKLKILQERLAQIKQKGEAPAPQEADVEIGNPTSQEADIESTTPTPSPSPQEFAETPPAIRPKKSSNNRKKLAIVLCSIMGIWMIAYGIFYGYTNIDSLISGFSSEETIEETIPFKLTYNFDLGKSGVVAIIGSFEDEGSAKARVNDLVVKGFKCSYFFLPDNSNSKEEVYKVFIGPYENEEETNQWTENLELEAQIVKL